MKIVKQFLVIIIVSFIAEVLHHVIPLPIAASVCGLVIMLVLLITKIVKLEQVEETGSFLISVMPILFIPPTVSLVSVVRNLGSQIVGYFILALISTLITTVVTGHIVQGIIKSKKKGRD